MDCNRRISSWCLADALDTLDQLGVRVRWESVSLYGVTPVEDPATIADLFITDANSTSHREVMITTTATGESVLGTPAPLPCK